MKPARLLLLLACAAAAASAACARDPGGYKPLRAGDEVPAFAAPDLGGDTVSLAGLRGSAVMLNVWATWCPPCREEMPALQALHERYHDRGLHVIGVSVDSRGAEAAITEFLNDQRITFLILHDPAESVSRQFRTLGVPETFLIDGSGRLVRRWIGRFDPLADAVIAQVEQVLPQ